MDIIEPVPAQPGGKPEQVLELQKGSKINDLLFSPDGKKLVLDIDNRIFILTFRK